MSDGQTPMLRAAQFRQQAEEIRAIANRVTVADFKRQLLEIAEGYDRLAERAEKDNPHS